MPNNNLPYRFGVSVAFKMLTLIALGNFLVCSALSIFTFDSPSRLQVKLPNSNLFLSYIYLAFLESVVARNCLILFAILRVPVISSFSFCLQLQISFLDWNTSCV